MDLSQSWQQSKKSENAKASLDTVHKLFMERIYTKCTDRCLGKKYYNASFPSKKEKRCLNDCFQSGIHSNMIFTVNSFKMTQRVGEYLDSLGKEERFEGAV